MRALHWADKKDTSLNSRLRKDSLHKFREQELLSLRTRLKEEASEMAYDDWLEKKNVSNSQVPTPAACERRKKVRSSSGQRTSTCTTCTRTHTKRQSALVNKRVPQIATPIKVNHHQETRNVDSVGKSEKLYPYTNYPPKHLRSHSSEELCRTHHKPKSGRSSRSTVCSSSRSSRQLLTGKKTHRKSGLRTPISKSQATQLATVKRDELEGHTSETDNVPVMTMTPGMKIYHEENSCPKSDIEIANTVNREHRTEDVSVGSNDLQGYYSEEDDDEEDLLFHDVGDTNNLNALALPNTLTKDKTPAEVLQILRAVDGTGSRSFKRSQSTSLRRNSIQMGNYARRLSLTAIPEGRIVTSYSDEEQSTSQLLDDDFIEALIRSFSNESNVKQTQATTDALESRKIAWQMGDKNDEEEIMSKVEAGGMASDTGPTIEVLSPLDNQFHRNITLGLSKSDPIVSLKTNYPEKSQTNSQNCYSLGCTDQNPQTLKVINIEWNPLSNTVQSTVTACPLTPPPEHSQRQLSLRKLTPPSGFLSPRSLSPSGIRSTPRALSSSLSSSRSCSPISPLSPTFLSDIEGQVDIDSSPPTPLSSRSYSTSLHSQSFHPRNINNPNCLSLSSKSIVMSSSNNIEELEALRTSGLKRAKSAPEMREELENPAMCLRTSVFMFSDACS